MSETTTPSPSYRPGDKVRVLVDEPYSTELAAGDIVTVIQQTTKTEPDGSDLDVVQVATDGGTRWLGLDVVEPFADAYRPAEPDEVVDAQLRAIFDGDPELAAWAHDAEIALGAEDAKVSDRLQPTHADDLEHYEGFVLPGPGNQFVVKDFNDDVLTIAYAEHNCPKHGKEGAFFFSVNDHTNPVIIPAALVGPVIAFLLDRARFSQRPE
ncbi:hypothetical protein JNUCC0626_18405 [Lentzea sp. JNUCC 0626]|uniref:hypothetical protein n=1 Tax=Lentzea sp. JNUCC 0626 TaxID=3367513 RepID=UPI00374A8B5F